MVIQKRKTPFEQSNASLQFFSKRKEPVREDWLFD